ncbi:2-methylcitrate dehydratase [Pseudofrankia sp. BMG5.36]|nr:2-methylcitrate dehydratase [Pseudofrankia sp. BMG5.36]
MRPTIVEALADFTCATDFSKLPPEVVAESKRVLLDSIGCGLAGKDQLKGIVGIELASLSHGARDDATVIGSSESSSVFGAAFANSELISALDFDAILAPGHVAPVVIPVALASGESAAASGKEVLTAIAIGHEISCRIAYAMDGLRDVESGKVLQRPVVGYSCIVFGAAATSTKLMNLPPGPTASAIGIVGSIAPVHSHGAWSAHTPSTTVKYMVGGAFAQTALTAAYMGKFGHRGDREMLDDTEFGFPRFIGTSRWDHRSITRGLGVEWLFPKAQTYKPYPHCRVLHGLIDTLVLLVEEHDLKPDEIQEIRSWGEGWHRQPTWLNTNIEHVVDAQNSMSHGLALAAHRIPPSKRWQDQQVVFDSSVMGLMTRVVTKIHPSYTGYLNEYPANRPARIEIDARGTMFAAERMFPKGTPSIDPSTTMSTEELVAKFRTNADGELPDAAVDAIVATVLDLQEVPDVRDLTRLLRP